MLGLFFTLAVAFGALALTTFIGVPLAVRFARPKVWGRSQIGELPLLTDFGRANPSFTPLDLGPDPVLWPSQKPWKVTARKELPWPSQTWDDPHFGRQWRTDMTGAAADEAYERQLAARRARSAERRQAVADEKQHRAKQVLAKRASEKRDLQPEETNQQRARQEMRQIRERAAQMKSEMSTRVGEEAAKLKKKAKAEAKRAAQKTAQQVAPELTGAMAKVPPPAELERLVANVGLAGTVQEIMKRTGWDFKTAAQYLAKARRGR